MPRLLAISRSNSSEWGDVAVARVETKLMSTIHHPVHRRPVSTPTMEAWEFPATWCWTQQDTSICILHFQAFQPLQQSFISKPFLKMAASSRRKSTINLQTQIDIRKILIGTDRFSLNHRLPFPNNGRRKPASYYFLPHDQGFILYTPCNAKTCSSHTRI